MVRDVEFTPRPRSAGTARSRGPNALQRRKATEVQELLDEGRCRIGVLSERDLLIAGTALYAGEGSKTDGVVKLANSDPRMIQLFATWLRRFIEVHEERLRVALYLHKGLDLASAMAFWEDVTEVPASQFQKPYRAEPDPSIRRSKHPMGCATLVYAHARAHRAVMGLVSALLESAVALPG